LRLCGLDVRMWRPKAWLRTTFGRHILTSKPHKRKKKLHRSVVADKADQPVLKRMLPY